MITASVVIVGAGVVGASVAYHLAARGWRNVCVLERAATPGAGSTRLATGGYRSFFATPINVRLSLLARAKLETFLEEIGIDPGYRPAGYLWLAVDNEQMAALRRVRATHLQVEPTDAVEIDATGAAAFNLALDTSGVCGGIFDPSAGFIEPLRILDGYLAAARRLGARVEFGAEVVGFRKDARGRIHRVLSAKEEIAADFVVNAAGPWAATVAALAGVELPVSPLRRQVAVTRTFNGLPEDMPMTIFLGDGFHLRVRERRVLLLFPSPGTPGKPFDTAVDPAWISAVYALACRRVPSLRQTVIDESMCYAGLYEMSPDQHALLGAAPGCENLLLVNGSSGHGVMHAPALGQLVAEILSEGRAQSMDIGALRPSRFVEGSPNPTDSLL